MAQQYPQVKLRISDGTGSSLVKSSGGNELKQARQLGNILRLEFARVYTEWMQSEDKVEVQYHAPDPKSDVKRRQGPDIQCLGMMERGRRLECQQRLGLMERRSGLRLGEVLSP